MISTCTQGIKKITTRIRGSRKTWMNSLISMCLTSLEHTDMLPLSLGEGGVAPQNSSGVMVSRAA